MAILVVEDEQELSDILVYVLRRAGYDVTCAHDGMSALKEWRTTDPSLILLDLSLPRLDGWEVCRQIRSTSAVPIVMLTAQKNDEEIVRGLNVGADDYITKPFSPSQLVARVEAVLRRTEKPDQRAMAKVMRIGEVELDLQMHSVNLPSGEVRLTNLEFRLLHALSMRDGAVVMHRDLIQRVWGYHGLSDGRMLKSHIRNLRKKIEPDPAHPRYLHTVSGVGYRFTGTPAMIA